MLRRWISRAVGLSQQSPNIPNLPEIMSSEVLTSGRSSRRLRPGAGANDPPCNGCGRERSPENAPMSFGSGAGERAGMWNGCAKHRARG